MGRRYASALLVLALVPLTRAGAATERSTSGDTAIPSAAPPKSETGVGDLPPSQARGQPRHHTFDLTALRVAEYRWGKQAAASYTFDDGPPSSFQIADIFESAGLRATFFIVPGLVSDAEWSSWKAVAGHGHEIANHSLSHLDLSSPDLTDEQLTRELVGAQQVIAERLGEAPVTFAFPYNSPGTRSGAIALSTHLATRIPGLPFRDPSIRWAFLDSRTTLESMDDALLQTLAERGWLVVNGHGIDGDGWEPITSEVLTEHVTLAANLSADLWVDTFANVARYRLASQLVHPVIIAASRSTLRVRLEGAVEAPLDAVKLTIEIPVVEWPAAIRAQDASGAELPLFMTSNALLVEARARDEILIEILPNRR